MHRLFVDPHYIEEEQVVLLGEPLRKVRTVLRMVPQETLTILDGLGLEYSCRIVSISSKQGLLEIIQKKDALGEPARKVHLGQALPKSDKMTFVIQKAVELGVAAVHPFVSRRSVPRYAAGKQSRRVERWRKIALESAQQSGRGLVPTVNEPVDFTTILSRSFSNGANLILHQGKMSKTLRKTLCDASTKDSLFILVGPEGGFDPEEVMLAGKHGFEAVNLGKRILRTETAALTFLSIAQYEFGEIY